MKRYSIRSLTELLDFISDAGPTSFFLFLIVVSFAMSAITAAVIAWKTGNTRLLDFFISIAFVPSVTGIAGALLSLKSLSYLLSGPLIDDPLVIPLLLYKIHWFLWSGMLSTGVCLSLYAVRKKKGK